MTIIPAAKIQVELDEKQIREFIEKELSNQLHQNLLLVDLPKMSELTNISSRYLEDNFLHDARIRQFERRKHRKRWWIWNNDGVGAKQAILDVMDEW